MNKQTSPSASKPVSNTNAGHDRAQPAAHGMKPVRAGCGSTWGALRSFRQPMPLGQLDLTGGSKKRFAQSLSAESVFGAAFIVSLATLAYCIVLLPPN